MYQKKRSLFKKKTNKMFKYKNRNLKESNNKIYF